MPDLTVDQLAVLDAKEYTDQIKMRLRDDKWWVIMLNPALIERTRASLNRIVDSIDLQKTRVAAEGATEESWLIKVNALRRHAKKRLDAIGPCHTANLTSSKEARAWRAFSARLAGALEQSDPVALEAITTPYGGLTARQWLEARDQKQGVTR